MCDNIKSYTGKRNKLSGYKIVAVNIKTGRYYSPAIGCRYPMDGNVPNVKTQKYLGFGFFSNILNPHSWAYNPKMKGLTGIFKNLKDALYIRDTINVYNNCNVYQLQIKKSVVEDNLHTGSYGGGCIIYLGSHIKFEE